METPEVGSKRNAILFVICMATTMIPFMGSAVNLALPLIDKDFSMNAIALAWVVSLFLLISAIFPVPFSKLADTWGRKRTFTIGVLVFTLASLVCALSVSGVMLIAGRFLQGLGASMMFATNMAIVTSIFPPNERGKALGIITAVVYISASSGPFFGGMLIHFLGWRSIFYVTSVIGLLVIVGISVVIKGEWKESKGGTFDMAGTLFYGVGLSLLIFGFSRLPSMLGIGLIVAGLAALVIFVMYEKKLEFPVLNVRLFWENKVFGLASTAALINYSSTFAISFLLSLYLQYIKGMSPQHAGFILMAQPIAQTILSPLAGRWSDKVDARNLATFGMSIIVVGLIMLFFIVPSTPMSVIIAISVLLGIGFGVFSSPNMNVIMGSVEKKYIGLASTTTNTMRLTGQAISMGITTMMISICVGTAKITPNVFPQFMNSIHITFIILAVLCSVGVFASWRGTQQGKD
jgi:EmrB/QacA subfamily drug resistance transporter